MDEKRLIDANALDKKLEVIKIRFKAQGRDTVAEDYNFVQTVLSTAPTVDAVEVVRCRDCKHWGSRTENEKGFIVCPASGMKIHTEDFCSYGERRNDEY